MTRYLILILILLSLSSCENLLLEEDYREGDFFYLENDGAIMPVWVKGNKASGVFIVFLHGGPGATSDVYANSATYKKLQEKYAFVYWDQRTSGASQGNAPKDSLNLAQYVEDTEKLIALIKDKYGVDKVFLIGKSWGGCLGTAYLLKPENQNNICGWVEIDGAHNFKEGIPMSQEWVKKKAQEKISAGEEADYWKGELDWYNTNPEINASYILRWGNHVNQLNGIYLNPDNDPGDRVPLRSPIPQFPIKIRGYDQLYRLNQLVVIQNFYFADIWLTPEMHKIKIPSMMLWGRHDGSLPVELAYDAYDNLGTEEDKKELHIFEHSAHGCSFEEPELFIEIMINFIEKYK